MKIFLLLYGIIERVHYESNSYPNPWVLSLSEIKDLCLFPPPACAIRIFFTLVMLVFIIGIYLCSLLHLLMAAEAADEEVCALSIQSGKMVFGIRPLAVRLPLVLRKTGGGTK